MGYIEFDKSQLINLEYSLDKEVLRTNRAGSYACNTIVGCNTRKYHGLLVSPLEEFEGEKHVLLASLDVTVKQQEEEFNLGIHKYMGDIYSPRGHKYVRDFECDDMPIITYRIGGVVMTKERILVENEAQILIKYTLEDAHLPVTLILRPFLAFREMHALSKENLYINTKIAKVPNGIKTRLYEGYPNLFLQFSKSNEFVQVPHWYYNIEYLKEMERGFDPHEDLYVPGYFEIPVKKGESIIFSASTKEANPQSLKRKFSTEFNKRIPRSDYKNCLINAAQQFIVRHKSKTMIIAGYPWHRPYSRDTFIALPGLTLDIDDKKTFEEVIDTMVKTQKNGLYPNALIGDTENYVAADVPLWFFWALQQYLPFSSEASIWNKYGKKLKSILDNFKKGTGDIKMRGNGLIFAGTEQNAVTWMNANNYGTPVTPRAGYAVEINALWYNAVCFAIQLAEKTKDTAFLKKWAGLPEKIRGSFLDFFWDEDRGYLADYCPDENSKNRDVRPNQLIAAALEYSPLETQMKKAVIDICRGELLTPRGLRSLSPKNEKYRGKYAGTYEERENAFHQGPAWPWLLRFFAESYLQINKRSGVSLVKKIYFDFEEAMMEHGIGTVSEIYDGDPPHNAHGTISQAWSVAALLSIENMLQNITS